MKRLKRIIRKLIEINLWTPNRRYSLKHIRVDREAGTSCPKQETTAADFLKASTAIGLCLGSRFGLRSKLAEAATPPVINDPQFSAPVIDPKKIPQFTDALPVPGTSWPAINAMAGGRLTLRAKRVDVQILPRLCFRNACWGYRGSDYTGTYLGPTIVTRKALLSPLRTTTACSRRNAHLLRRGTGQGSVVDKTLHGTDG